MTDSEQARTGVRRRMVAGTVLLAVGVLAIASTFGDLYREIINGPRAGSGQNVYTVASWSSGYQLQEPNGPTRLVFANLFGVPSVVGGLLAIVAAAVVLRGSGVPALVFRARLITAAAAAMLVGAAWTWGAHVAETIESTASAGSVVSVEIGTGLWVLGGSSVGALLGCALLIGVLPTPVPDAPDVLIYEVEMDTPPIGFPAPGQGVD